MKIISNAGIELTRQQLLALGLLRCQCGHPSNNHFTHGDSACAFCESKSLNESVVVGNVVALSSRGSHDLGDENG